MMMAKLCVANIKVSIIVAFACSQGISLADIHRCVSDGTTQELNLQPHSELETLVTLVRDHEKHGASQNCSWTVRPPVLQDSQPIHLVLQIKNKKPPASSLQPLKPGGSTVSDAASKCDFSLTVQLAESGFNRSWTDGGMLPKAPHVLPIFSSSQLLTVRFSTGVSEPSASCGRIELNIAIAKKGFCGKNMLLHRGRCLLISDERLALSDLSGTGAELAAIPGTEQLRDLLSDNSPDATRLDLSSPVRVVVFLCTSSQRLYFLDSSRCIAEPFISLTNNNMQQDVRRQSSKVLCATLQSQLGSLEPKLVFSDCNSPARSLLSFAESPTKANSFASACKTPREFLCEIANSPGTSLGPTESECVFFEVSVSLATLILLLLVIFVATVVRRRRCSNPDIQPADQSASARVATSSRVYSGVIASCTVAFPPFPAPVMLSNIKLWPKKNN